MNYILPLPTREPDRAKFERGFISVVGGLIRRINEKPLNINENDTIEEKLSDVVSFPNEDSQELFNHFIQVQFKELYSGKVDSLQQLEQVPLAESTNEQKGEKDYINFFYDTFIRGDEEYVQDILKRVDSPHIINEILSYVVADAESKEETKQQPHRLYKSHFANLRKQFLTCMVFSLLRQGVRIHN